jgi:hypothetical protein
MAKQKKTLEEASKEELLTELARRHSQVQFREDMSLQEMEQSVEQFKYESGAVPLKDMVTRLKPETGQARPCPRCARPIPVKAKNRERTLMTLSGPLTLVRNYHYCDTCKHGFYPRDAQLGLAPEGDLSPELEKRVTDMALNDPYGRVAQRWTVHYAFPISDNLARGAIERMGRMAEASEPLYVQEELKPRPEEPARVLYALSDGGMLPIRGKDGWKEAKMGVVFREDSRAAGGKKARGVITDARYAASMNGQEAFAKEMQALLQAEVHKAAQLVVWLGDGAAANWSLAQKLAPGCVEVLDWAHAVEHGMKLGKAVLGEESPWLLLWKSRIEQLLFQGDNDALIRELMECLALQNDVGEWLLPSTAIEALEDEVRYFRNNAHRMRYRLFREQGLLIGSGPVESAHRHVLQVRMKLAGQHWDPTKANRMARLRAAYRTNPTGFYEAIRRAHWRTRTEPIKRRAKVRRRASNR